MQALLARSAARSAAQTTRALHTTAPRRGGDYDYLHAKYMYQLRNKPANKLKTGALIFGGVAVGIYIPIFSVGFNQKKAGL